MGGGDSAMAANIQANANQSKPIAKWIPDWLLPDDLVERRNVEQGIKKAEPAPAAAPAAAAPASELPPAAVQDPNNPTNYVETKDPFEGNPMLKDAYEWFKTRKEGLASGREQDKWMSILASGLGMMGGTSPYAAANIGQGGMKGIEAALAAQKATGADQRSLMAGQLGLSKATLYDKMRRDALAQKALSDKALAEYRHRKLISQEEYSLKVNFLRQFPNKAIGEKEWAEILKIKKELEELEKKEKAQFDGDLKNIRRAQFLCFLVAGWIAYVIVWGGK